MAVTVFLCNNCGKRPGTETWVGEGGTLAYAHGMWSRWCKRCVITAQLAHARKLAATIPQLEAALTGTEGE